MKNKNYAFRISEKDLNTIKSKAKKAKLSVTDYITQTALGKEIIVIDGLPEIISELKRIGNNLNQLVMLSHQRAIDIPNLYETEKELSSIYWKVNDLVEVVNSDGSI